MFTSQSQCIMASTIFSQDPAHASVLSDGQIIEMLQAAETRLKSQQGAMSLRAKGSGSQSTSAQLRFVAIQSASKILATYFDQAL